MLQNSCIRFGVLSYVRFLSIIKEICQEHEFFVRNFACGSDGTADTYSSKLYNTNFYFDDFLKDLVLKLLQYKQIAQTCHSMKLLTVTSYLVFMAFFHYVRCGKTRLRNLSTLCIYSCIHNHQALTINEV